MLCYTRFGIVAKRACTYRWMFRSLSTELNIKTNYARADTNRLVVVLSWIQANPRAVSKYVDYYLKRESDVIVMCPKVQQVLWLGSGMKMAAHNLVEFLSTNKKYERVLIHGFSVGSVAWGVVLESLMKQPAKYEMMRKLIVGQVWDSMMALEVETAIKTLPTAVFPNSKWAQLVFEKYLRFHTRVFYNSATRPYIQIINCFRQGQFETPILIFASRDDHLTNIKSVEKTIQAWKDKGIPVDSKIWDSSPHVGHLLRYPQEYEEKLTNFLQDLHYFDPDSSHKGSKGNMKSLVVNNNVVMPSLMASQ